VRGVAGFLYDRRRLVLGAWVVVLLVLLVLARLAGPTYQFDLSIESSESVAALDLIDAHTPGTTGEQLTIAWRLPDDAAAAAEGKQTVETMLATVSGMDHVQSVTDPYPTTGPSPYVSKDGRTAYAVVTMDAPVAELPPADVNDIAALVEETNECTADCPDPETLTVAITGQALLQTNPPAASASEAIGLGLAAVVLLLAFGSVLAAALPLVNAVVALGAALATVTLLSHVTPVPSFGVQMMSLIGIGVGIDYALFVVSRHRAGLMRGMDVRDSVIASYDTSGRAVLFAGLTVVISLLGILVARIGFMNGLAIASSIGVLFTMVVTLTLLPALLGFLGIRVLGRRAQRELREMGPHDDERSTAWARWSVLIQRRPWLFIAIAAVLLLMLAIPARSLRIGGADQGSDAVGTTTRTAYDLVANAFGPGVNGPIVIVSSEGGAASMAAVHDAVAATDGVVAVTPVQTTPDGQVAWFTAIPAGRAQDTATSDLVAHLREDVLPAASPDSPVLVTGETALMDDVAESITGKLPWFLLGVLGLSSLLLMIVFRSIAIPVKAAVMNLAVAAAAFGVLAAVFQWGWGAGLIGSTGDTPFLAFLPIMLLAVLFGLSMDYQVFLVSRMREEWLRTEDNTAAVTLGLSETGKVITAAAAIMVVVFLAFVTAGEPALKMAGVGMAAAVFLDAFLIRSLLVPALMQVLGKWNWWLPRWLDRLIPHITV
jgi:putative drug exporter of the RND superfamily